MNVLSSIDRVDVMAMSLIVLVTEQLYSPAFVEGSKFVMTMVVPLSATLLGVLAGKSMPLKMALSVPNGEASKEQFSCMSDPGSPLQYHCKAEILSQESSPLKLKIAGTARTEYRQQYISRVGVGSAAQPPLTYFIGVTYFLSTIF